MEAARKLSLLADRNDRARQVLERLFGPVNQDVEAHAAVGLWRAGRTIDAGLVRAIAHGMKSSSAQMRLDAHPNLVSAAVDLLEAEDHHGHNRHGDVLYSCSGPKCHRTYSKGFRTWSSSGT